MSKRKAIEEIANIVGIALRHKIGAAINPDAPYAKKYMSEAERAISEAKEKVLHINFNTEDKRELEDKIKKKLQKELEQRPFIGAEKFSLIDAEIAFVLKQLELA